MTIVIPGMVTISLLSLFYCSMLPETARKARMQAFERQYIAHRGFHDNRGECPENSLPAFERAIQMGYGIELDVRIRAKSWRKIWGSVFMIRTFSV